MLKSIFKIAMISSALVSPAFAGSQTGQISDIVVRSSDGLVYFDLTGSLISPRPACASGTTYWMIASEDSESGKRQLAALLTARANGQPISVIGANTCTRWHDGEDVNSITY